MRTNDENIDLAIEQGNKFMDRIELMLDKSLAHQLTVLQMLTETDRTQMLIAQQAITAEVVMHVSSDTTIAFRDWIIAFMTIELRNEQTRTHTCKQPGDRTNCG